jgi:sulfite dehydrogenase (quinone) subunit SoeC
MHPAFSVISFTTLLGAAQGLLVTLGLMRLLGLQISQLVVVLAIAIVLLITSLAASFFHLGHPERAWRSAAMWRTSWLSREVIVLPAFIGLTVLWAFFEWRGIDASWVIVLLLLGSVALWLCTAMIYACLKFIQEWAHPLTLVNYTLIGIASGLVLCVSLFAALNINVEITSALIPWAIGLTAAALASRLASFQRNARIKPLSNLQTATGIRDPQLRQISMGMSAGAFNTREFFHHKTALFVRNAKSLAIGLGFVLPVFILIFASILESRALAVLAFPAQYLGLLCERWVFFAQARHPQNLYYQTVS